MAAPTDRRLGWLHQPSFKAGQSDMQDAGLVEPTQPTSMAPDTLRIQKDCSRLAPLLQGQRLGWHHVATAKYARHMPHDHRQRFLLLALPAVAPPFGQVPLNPGAVSSVDGR